MSLIDQQTPTLESCLDGHKFGKSVYKYNDHNNSS